MKNQNYIALKFSEVLLKDLKHYTDYIEVDGDSGQIRMILVNMEDKNDYQSSNRRNKRKT